MSMNRTYIFQLILPGKERKKRREKERKREKKERKKEREVM